MSTTSQDPVASRTFGDFIRQTRIRRGVTQRDVARQIDMLPSNLCKLERGALAAPSDGDQLQALAKSLGLDVATPDRDRFFDLAAESNRTVPQDLAEVISANEAAPLLLRTLGNRRLTADQVDAVVRIIRGETG